VGIEIPESVREQAVAQYQNAPTWRLIVMPLISMTIFTPVVSIIVAGVLFGVFAMFGGGARFKQVFALVVHTGVVMSVRPPPGNGRPRGSSVDLLVSGGEGGGL
jgi:hypothetical protein